MIQYCDDTWSNIMVTSQYTIYSIVNILQKNLQMKCDWKRKKYIPLKRKMTVILSLFQIFV